MKRLNTLLVVLVTLSMLVVPLASAATMSPATAGQETLSTQPPADDAASLAQPAPQMTLAQPTGKGPVLAVDGMEQQPAPAMSIAQPADGEQVVAAQEPVAPAFELVSVVRSCEDLTRFDLTWTGIGTISSIEYVLYNSSDNGNTPGTINGADIAGTTASITGRPGDTAISLDVQLVDSGVYSYVADASECGVSSFTVTQQPDATVEPTVDPTAETVIQTPTVESTPRVAAQTATTSTVIALSETYTVLFEIDSNGVLLPSGYFLTIRDTSGEVVGQAWQNYLGQRRVDLPSGTYTWNSPATGPWQQGAGSFTVGNAPLTVNVELAAAKNGVVNVAVELPADYSNQSPFLSFRATDSSGISQTFNSVLVNGSATIGPLSYGIYEFAVQAPWGSEWSQPVAVSVDDEAINIELSLPKPATSILKFHIDSDALPIEDGYVRITGGLVWNGEYYHEVAIEGPGTYEIEVRHPTDGYPVGFSVRATDHEEAYGDWNPGDSEDIYIDLEATVHPTPTKVIDILLQDSASGENIGEKGLYTDNSCSQKTDMVQVSDYYQLQVFDGYQGYCLLRVYIGEYGGYHEWAINIGEVGGQLVYELPWDSTWVKDVNIHVSAPEGITPLWVHLHYGSDPSGISVVVGNDGYARFGALRKGTYSVNVSTGQEHYFTEAIGDITITSDGETIPIEMKRNPSLVTVDVEVKTSDGGNLPSSVVVSHGCGGKCGPVPQYHLTPTGSTTTFQLQYPGDWPLTLYVNAGGKYRFSSVSFVPSETQQVTLTLQAITSIPATPAAYLSSSQGAAGSIVTVSGGGYVPGETVTIRWNGSGGTILGSVTVKADGTFSGKVTVPSYAGVGAYEIHTVSASGSATASYQVTALAVVKVTLNPTSGRAGTVTTVSGSGFRPGESVTVRWGGASGTLLGSVTASTSGTITARVTVPATAAAGAFAIHATGASGQTGSASYQVTALALVKVILSPISGRAGTVTSVTGSGYRPGETVTIRWSTTTGTVLGAVKATTSGTISAKVTVPATAAVGTFRVYVTGASGQTGSATYQVTALAIVKVALSPTYGRAGTVTSVTGSGFRPGELVTIRWGGATGTILGSVKATTSGSISAKVTVPATAALGTFTIRATGASGQVGTASYKVTALAIVKITLSPASGRAGTVTTVSGSGFRPGETVTIRWASATGTVLGSVKATASGTFSAKVTVPRSATVRVYTIYVSGATSLQKGTATYSVTQLAAEIPTRRDVRAGGSGTAWFVMRT